SGSWWEKRISRLPPQALLMARPRRRANFSDVVSTTTWEGESSWIRMTRSRGFLAVAARSALRRRFRTSVRFRARNEPVRYRMPVGVPWLAVRQGGHSTAAGAPQRRTSSRTAGSSDQLPLRQTAWHFEQIAAP